MVGTRTHLAPTITATIDVVVEIHISHTCLEFEVEVLGQSEGKAVGDACSIGITLITMVCQLRKIRAKE